MQLHIQPRLLLSTLTFAAVVTSASAQRSAGGDPPSLWSVLSASVPSEVLTTPDVGALLAEDAQRSKGTPQRYGALQPVEISPEASGSWDLADGDVPVWRMRVQSPGAYTLSLIFDEFKLPPGAELYVYDDERRMTLGAFTSLNNKADRQFATQPVPGDALTLELLQPDWVAFPAELHLSTVVHDYIDVFKGGTDGGSGSCNIDVNCPQGAGWESESRSVARTFSGGFLCSGALINNTSEDGRQFFLTANHCGSMNSAVFLFNYEKAGCNSGGAPSNQSVQGSVLRANGSASDYRLVEITEAIPSSYNVFYSGWDRTAVIPSNTAGIHHPSGDVKKICFDNNSPGKDSQQWHIFKWDLGVTEGGSSGSPLFNQDHQIIGQLCCGAAQCGFLFDDFYGRFDRSWSGLSQHLDGVGAGVTTLDGFDPAGGGPGGPSCSVAQYGTGLGGANTLTLSTSSLPKTGTTMVYTINGVPNFSNGVMLYSIIEQSIPVLGGTILVDFVSPAFTGSFITTLGGTAVTTFAIPDDMAWIGITGFVQAGVIDPAQPFGWAFSNGLEIGFCD